MPSGLGPLLCGNVVYGAVAASLTIKGKDWGQRPLSTSQSRKKARAQVFDNITELLNRAREDYSSTNRATLEPPYLNSFSCKITIPLMACLSHLSFLLLANKYLWILSYFLARNFPNTIHPCWPQWQVVAGLGRVQEDFQEHSSKELPYI